VAAEPRQIGLRRGWGREKDRGKISCQLDNSLQILTTHYDSMVIDKDDARTLFKVVPKSTPDNVGSTSGS